MTDMKRVREVTHLFYKDLKSIMALQNKLSDDYLNTLISLGLSKEEAGELYLETSALAGKEFMEQSGYEVDSDYAKNFIDLMEGHS